MVPCWRNYCSRKSSPDQVVEMVVTRHATKAEFARKAMHAASFDLCFAGTGMRLADIPTQAESTSYKDWALKIGSCSSKGMNS